MSESERVARTVFHNGREFVVAIEERYAGMATGGIGRIAVLFWTITTHGYPPYPSVRVLDTEQNDDFFEDLVAKEWPNIQAAGSA